jgi:hypothetical protein
MMKAARIDRRGIVDHGLSLLLFFCMLAEFVLVTQAASATFFLLLVMSFFDVLGGFILTLGSTRPDVGVERSEPTPESVETAPEKIGPAPESAEHVPS